MRALAEEAAGTGDPGDPYVVAHVAAATAWSVHPLGPRPATGDGESAPGVTRDGESAPRRALVAARVTGDPVLVSGAMDAVISEAADEGRLREAYRTAGERLTLRAAMDPYDPRSGIEIVDSLHTASVYAVAVGDLPGALEIAWMAMRDDVTGGHPALARSRLIAPLVLAGAFHEALARGAEMWESQARMDAPPGRWMAPALSWMALACDHLGDDAGARSWRARAEAVGGSRLTTLRAFTAARTAADRLADGVGRMGRDVEAVVEEAGRAAGMFAGYAVAAGAELAVLAGLADAGERLAAAEPAGRENAWAAACLTRAAGRLPGGDREALEASVEGWERIGARYERARTLLLLPGREAEGRDELAAMEVILTDRSEKA
ncbi:hypothetical protein [Nonomuraea sp. SBT364]|uniref:hypothetical protein n=1 Tax=Nonomuraea sp. SBT364 TaxID=1580530 RepID=UPI0012E111B3|nr:hypothetical protein [Nonomuraea sp. SBT364]